MKKITVITFVVVVLGFLWNYMYFYSGNMYIRRYASTPETIAHIENDAIYLDSMGEEIRIKGVRMGLSKPGYYSSERGVTKEEYLQWLRQIEAMGANTVTLEKLAPKEFYDALYLFNTENDKPLYLIQCIPFDDYLINSSYSAGDPGFYEPFLEECKKTIDAVHGRKKITDAYELLPIYYNKDVSPWLIGYAPGGDWESTLVAYTNELFGEKQQYKGEYLYTENGSNFEVFLAKLGDELIKYETLKFARQTPIAFLNWAMTDPLTYDEDIAYFFKKPAGFDVERILATPKYKAGQYAAYSVFAGYPDFCKYFEMHEENTFAQYLKLLNDHHTMPLVILNFGASSSRAVVVEDESMGRDQGGLNEVEQGQAIVSMYQDIINSGCAGAVISTWQDEWYKSTWNTVSMVENDSTAYWLDVQCLDQHWGLLAFDPGEEKCICYVDGEISDWTGISPVVSQDGYSLHMQYDEGYLYFLIESDDKWASGEPVYLPIDVTPKSGSKRAENLNLDMSEAADFVIEINGTENSRAWVHDRYSVIDALFYSEISAQNFFSKEFPEKDCTSFSTIRLLQQEDEFYIKNELDSPGTPYDQKISFREYDYHNAYQYKIKKHYETGKLRFGNTDPDDVSYDSMADYYYKDGIIEIRIPWLMLNFADPTRMFIHDDYYECLGVEYLAIKNIKLGIGNGLTPIVMQEAELRALGNNPKYHERLKKSYYLVRDCWSTD